MAVLLVTQTGWSSAAGANKSAAEPSQTAVQAEREAKMDKRQRLKVDAQTPRTAQMAQHKQKKTKGSRGEWQPKDRVRQDKKRVEQQKFRQQAILIRYKAQTSERRKASLRQAEGLKVLRSYPKWNLDVVVPQAGSVAETVKRLQRRSDVVAVIPNKRLNRYGVDITREPLFAQQWGLHNIGQRINNVSGKTDVDINAPEAVQAGTGVGVVVAVIDSGVDVAHPDLFDRIWINTKEVPDNGVDDDGNGYVDDVNGWDFINQDSTVFDPGWDDDHGTHVAGIIAASLNGEGVVGVAPDAKIMPLKIFEGDYGDLWAALDAIAYAEAMGAKIANLSWGGPASAEDQFLYDVMAKSNLLFVVAAGNENLDIDQYPQAPASFNLPNQITVAAVDWRGDITTFSNYSMNSVHIAAPGDEILSTVTLPGGSAVTLSEVGSGRAIVLGFGLEDLADAAEQETFLRLALETLGGLNQPIVLVDDDDSELGFPETSRQLAILIQRVTGRAPRVLRTAEQAVTAQELAGNVVVWSTGWSTGPYNAWALSDDEQRELEAFLQNGGRLLLSGRDALYGIEESRFVQDVLGIQVESDVFGSTTVMGVYDSWMGHSFFVQDGDNTGSHDRLYASGWNTVSLAEHTGLMYDFYSGTSMAAPFVAGVAALVWSKKPSLTAKEVRWVILTYAKPLPGSERYTVTGRMVDAQRALAGLQTQRVSGADRYETAVSLSQQRFQPGVPVVYLATGQQYPDALTAVPVAGKLGGPVLLVRRDELPPAVAQELTRLKPQRIVILGGPAVVSGTVELKAKQYAPRVERLYGMDRYETAVKLSRSAFASGVPVAFVAIGTNFPDALSAGPAAIRLGGPVLLTKPSILPAAVKQELQRLKPKKIVVLGGASIVSAAVVNELARIAPVERWYGADRYATAVIVGQKAFGTNATVYLATGRDFPDALVAGVVAGLSGAPILLVNGASLPSPVRDRLSQAPPFKLVVVGGYGAVPHATVLQAILHLRLVP